ncbi:MAG: hypothetical protein H7Y59_01355 [Anaerolineales bacterium]|nr:hypothetical protein [Anaerolineales bacterium]
MKKANKIDSKDYDDGMLPEYDFTGKKGVRGKYYRAREQGYTVRIYNEDGSFTEKHFGPTITLEPDIAKYFPDSESVNNALRTLISLVPNKQVGEKKAKYKVSKKPAKKIAVRK